MYKPEVAEEFFICGSVQSILGFAVNEVLKLGCTLEITWEASSILMPEPPSGDSVSSQGTSGVILTRSQGRELLLGR